MRIGIGKMLSQIPFAQSADYCFRYRMKQGVRIGMPDQSFRMFNLNTA